MTEPDTIKLLRECDAGIKTGIASIDDVLDYVSDSGFKQKLRNCKSEHVTMMNEIQSLLNQYQDDGKEPDALARGMSFIKTNVKLVLNESDQTIADLMTDGCNMGIKSLHKYLNQYQAADETAKDIAKRLIHLEENLNAGMQDYL